MALFVARSRIQNCENETGTRASHVRVAGLEDRTSPLEHHSRSIIGLVIDRGQSSWPARTSNDEAVIQFYLLLSPSPTSLSRVEKSGIVLTQFYGHAKSHEI